MFYIILLIIKILWASCNHAHDLYFSISKTASI